MKSSMKRSMKVSIKSKKSIRKMTGLPVTRRAAHIRGLIPGLQRRVDTLVDEIYHLECDCGAETVRADSNLEMWQEADTKRRAAEVVIGRLLEMVPELLLPVARAIVKDPNWVAVPAECSPAERDCTRDCTIEGSGCGHIPGDDECNECPNWRPKDRE